IACFLLKHKVLNAKDVVEHTSKGNRNITLLEMKKKVGGGFGFSTRWVILNELKDAGIKEITEVKVKEITNNHGEKGQKNRGVVYEKDGQEHFINADTVIIAVGYSSNNELQKQIEGKFAETYFIGDCVRVRTALEAIHEGFEVALKI
ncbi:MAG: FAD-dependent oxidoreductase, partial [Planctomycetes bacterium]|nr:FAD-dependent oxidoreductase [Planctomycetota bacterium]